MIRAMVERLAARLQQDGSDADGWIRLLRSYMVLGESEKARAALIDARSALKRRMNRTSCAGSKTAQRVSGIDG